MLVPTRWRGPSPPIADPPRTRRAPPLGEVICSLDHSASDGEVPWETGSLTRRTATWTRRSAAGGSPTLCRPSSTSRKGAAPAGCGCGRLGLVPLRKSVASAAIGESSLETMRGAAFKPSGMRQGWMRARAGPSVGWPGPVARSKSRRGIACSASELGFVSVRERKPRGVRRASGANFRSSWSKRCSATAVACSGTQGPRTRWPCASASSRPTCAHWSRRPATKEPASSRAQPGTVSPP